LFILNDECENKNFKKFIQEKVQFNEDSGNVNLEQEISNHNIEDDKTFELETTSEDDSFSRGEVVRVNNSGL